MIDPRMRSAGAAITIGARRPVVTMRRGLSQRELAQASKVSHSLITKLEHGPGDPGAPPSSPTSTSRFPCSADSSCRPQKAPDGGAR
ncbi:helix-turn-helix domain-containing protein [Streptomyces sp. NPDC003660]